MSQKRQVALYVSLLSSLASLARDRQESEAREVFLDIADRLKDDFCPPFDRSSLLILASDLYALAVFRKAVLADKDDNRFFDLFISTIGSLADISLPKYDVSVSEELIRMCAKKSRTSQGFLYLASVRSLLSLIGSSL